MGRLSGELWDAGTIGVREIDVFPATAQENECVRLIASFETNATRDNLLERFSDFAPQWTHENETDWVRETERAWPGRLIGQKLFLAAPWCLEETPTGRERLIHNPGLACGTGEHPCTQLALQALERVVRPGCVVADIGTGSGILAIAALRLGAVWAAGSDIDEEALKTARGNFELNGLATNLVVGSVDCFSARSVDVAVANINASVLLALADDLVRIVRPGGASILTGFPLSEAGTVRALFGATETLERDGWSCLISRAS